SISVSRCGETVSVSHSARVLSPPAQIIRSFLRAMVLLPTPVAKLSVLVDCNSAAVTTDRVRVSVYLYSKIAAESGNRRSAEALVCGYHPGVRVEVTVREAPEPR